MDLQFSWENRFNNMRVEKWLGKLEILLAIARAPVICTRVIY
jgi:hypothetical protein